jgi:hypothetical protein
MPFSNRAQLSFPAVTEALDKLKRWGVQVAHRLACAEYVPKLAR